MKGADRKYIHPARKVLRKRLFGGLSPFLCCPGKWSRLNRISHPHWVKICDDHNGQINLCAKQKYKVLSSTDIRYKIEECTHRINGLSDQIFHLMIA